MTKSKLVLIGLAATSLCVARVNAQPPAGGPGMGGPPHMHGGPGRLIKLLFRSTDLTPDQETQMHQILDADRPAVHDLFTQLRQANDDLTNLLLGPQDVQADALSAQLTRIAELRQQLAQHEAAVVLKIRSVVTPEQLAKAAAAKDQMPGRHGRKPPCGGNAN